MKFFVGTFLYQLQVHVSSTSIQVKCIHVWKFVKTNRYPHENNMDQKRTKFSPSNIDELEKTVIARLVGLRDENRYSVPDEFRGRIQTTWDTLVEAFPMPAHLNIPTLKQTLKQTVNSCKPIYDCFLPPSYNCICYKCLVATAPDVSYFHEIMEQADIEGSDEKSPLLNIVPDEDARLDTNDSFLSCVVHAAHFYTDYVYVPGVATYNEVPSTPTFSRVRFNAPATNDQEMRRKYIRRMKIVPVRLVF